MLSTVAPSCSSRSGCSSIVFLQLVDHSFAVIAHAENKFLEQPVKYIHADMVRGAALESSLVVCTAGVGGRGRGGT